MYIQPSSFHLKEIGVVYTNRNEWLSTGLLKSIKHKKKLFYQSKIKPTEENIQKYKSYRNKLTNLIRSTEREYYNNQFPDLMKIERVVSIFKLKIIVQLQS